MQFVAHGPDIPDTLLQAHEEGRVVFFCGAGISYPAGLPGFGGLVDSIYDINREKPTEIEKEAIDRQKYDAALDLLERRLQGQRLAVRRALAQALTPNLTLKGALDTHIALLRLARCRNRALRMVTTNFDQLFHSAARSEGCDLHSFAAPLLPIPKSSRWDGLVFLHGLLPGSDDDTALNRLVVTSGDFGLAYLTERWAARFVGELFRHYVVCFVGYSINDPVLRYMMDALAADRLLGEHTPRAWAIGDTEPGNEHRKTIEWEAKGVTPILYYRPTGSHDHSALHDTLKTWGTLYRDGVIGKERVVVSHALAHPSASTRQDDYVGRMLWALSDQSGLPARRFASFNPVPPLDWLLEAFSDNRFQHCDLRRFGVSPHDEEDASLRFSLICRPSSYVRSPPMQLIAGAVTSSEWDSVMLELARWTTRHLNDPRLLLWASKTGCALHRRWSIIIEHQLGHLEELERAGKSATLNDIRLHAPNAIPSRLVTAMWRLIIAGRVKSEDRHLELFRWRGRLQHGGLTTTMRCELRQLLVPQLALKGCRRRYEHDPAGAPAVRLRELFDWELVLAADEVTSAIGRSSGDEWDIALPSLLGDFQQLLIDALELLEECGEADGTNDPSRLDLQSISPHPQNRSSSNWVCLIELLRDAWLSVLRSDTVRALSIAEAWFGLRYPTFKRLALFAASKDNCIAPAVWVKWLLADDGWCLWSTHTQREVLRLLVLQGNRLEGDLQDHLEIAILAGPPREGHQLDRDETDWKRETESDVWLRLAKLNTSGLSLGAPAATRLADLTQAFPDWRLAPNESDEFLFWMTFSGEPGHLNGQGIEAAPRTRRDLVMWLERTPLAQRPSREDEWPEICRERFFRSLFALCDLSKADKWPIHRWQEALQVWCEDKRVMRSWRFAAPLVGEMSDETLQKVAHSVTRWLEKASKAADLHEEILLGLCGRLLTIPLDEDVGMTCNGEPLDEPLLEAINHPVGHITQTLINYVYKRNPSDNDRLPSGVTAMLSGLCDPKVDRFRHGQVLLGSHIISLFRIDRDWTEKHFLPLFDWSDPPVARRVWMGFLWSARIHPPLLIAIRPQFLQCSKHYAELGEQCRNYAALLIYVALGPVDGFSMQEFKAAIGSLPPDGLEECALALAQAIEGAGDQREEYWKNRVFPLWREVWPRSSTLATSRVAESFVRVIIAARGELPAALASLIDWVIPVPDLDYVVPILQESGMCSRFPSESLQLLNSMISNQQWVSTDLGKCLKDIVQSNPLLERDERYQRLMEFARMRDAFE